MKVHTNYLNAVILFALAFLLAAATGPVAAQQPDRPTASKPASRRRSTSLSTFSMIPPSGLGWTSSERHAIRPKPPR